MSTKIHYLVKVNLEVVCENEEQASRIGEEYVKWAQPVKNEDGEIVEVEVDNPYEIWGYNKERDAARHAANVKEIEDRKLRFKEELKIRRKAGSEYTPLNDEDIMEEGGENV